MDWLEVHLDTNHKGLEEVQAFLCAQGVDNFVIDDETEFHEFLEDNRQYWDYVDEDLERQMQGKSRVTFYLSADQEGYSQLAQLRIAMEDFSREHPQCAPLRMTLDNLQDADWENNWKQFYHPMEIGGRLLVIPQWLQEDPQVKAQLAAGRVPLVLDPGLTFGTGSHATTRLCLTALEELVEPGGRVLDLGCGSGILSIAALALGAREAAAVDIDPTCVPVAYENAALNGIGKETYTVQAGDVLADEALASSLGSGYDIVVANIVADVIIALAPRVRQFLKKGGAFLCSGIIDDRAEEVAQALQAAGWTIQTTRSAEGWFSYLCK